MKQSKSIRQGFSLIELLAAISIIGILVGMLLLAAGRSKEGQAKSITGQNMLKIASLLDQQLKAVIDQANTTQVSPAYIQFAGNDTRRAKSIWLKVNIRKDFPQSFSELADQTNFPPAPPIFKDAKAVGNTGNTNLESAALLYLTLNNARRGVTQDLDQAVGSGAVKTDQTIGSKQFRVFVDQWGTPIAFRRVPDNKVQTELNDAKYAGGSSKSKSYDAADRDGLLLNSWNPVSSPINIAALQSYLGHPVGSASANNNYQPYLVSAGSDMKFGTDDDLYSFRLREVGQRGD